MLRVVVSTRNTTFFQAKKKSSKKSRWGHYRLCPSQVAIINCSPLWLRTVHRTVRLTRRARNALKDYYFSTKGDSTSQKQPLGSRGCFFAPLNDGKNGNCAVNFKIITRSRTITTSFRDKRALPYFSGNVLLAWNPLHGSNNPTLYRPHCDQGGCRRSRLGDCAVMTNTTNNPTIPPSFS